MNENARANSGEGIGKYFPNISGYLRYPQRSSSLVTSWYRTEPSCFEQDNYRRNTPNMIGSLNIDWLTKQTLTKHSQTLITANFQLSTMTITNNLMQLSNYPTWICILLKKQNWANLWLELKHYPAKSMAGVCAIMMRSGLDSQIFTVRRAWSSIDRQGFTITNGRSPDDDVCMPVGYELIDGYPNQDYVKDFVYL